jgi:GNAT superfamily N-acetyltransferase
MASAMRAETVELRDGSRVLIRAMCPDDKRLLVRAFERLSEESRYRRFFAPKKKLTEGELVSLTEVDHSDREALVAIDARSGEGVGVARYARSPAAPKQAEAAVAVVDDWQGRGAGRALLERLADRARSEGVRCFTATVKAYNRPALAMVERLVEIRDVSRDAGEVELLLELPSHGIGAQLAEALREAAARPWLIARTFLHRLVEDPGHLAPHPRV